MLKLKNSAINNVSHLNEYLEKKKKEEDEEKKKKQKQQTSGGLSLKSSAVEDIAPVISSKTEDSTWFKKSNYFDDGYQFGDVTKTILGTLADVGEDITTGAIGMGEKALDSLLTLGTAMNKANTAQANFNLMSSPYAFTKKGKEIAPGLVATNNALQEESERITSDFVKKDLYDEEKIAKAIISAPIKEHTGMNVEGASVLGKKSDSLVQSGGQLLGTVALEALGMPWFLTMGLTSAGAETENALKQGATFEQATMSGLISAGAEILSEKLSGGIKFGGKTLDDVLLKPFTEKISNKAVKSLVNLGVDAVGEGAEEIFSGVFSNLGTALYKEDSIGELLMSEEAVDGYIEGFIGGAVLGGFSSGVRSVANRNAIELTDIEQKVFDKVVEDRIAEKQKDGKAVSAKDEGKIRTNVLRDLLKGNISTDTIESVLGGDEYESYKKVVEARNKYESLTNKETSMLQEEYKSLQEEYNELNKLDLTKAKLGDHNRQTEIKDRMAEIEAKIEKNNLSLEEFKKDSILSDKKKSISKNVFDIVKDSRLAESYYEADRQNYKFQADVSKYKNENARKTVQSAIDSGLLNNRNTTHEFVDMVAKISADKGMSFDFVDNKKIQETGFAVEGKTVNGYKTDEGNIAVNIEAKKALNVVAGHEITHILEGTEFYSELQQVVENYAKAKGEYDTRYQALSKMYEGVYKGEKFDKKIKEELTADMVGEYLFTDAEFVNRLSTEKPHLFKWLYDEIKYLCKVATAGSKEARELEKVKKAFEKAYKESAKSTDTKLSLSSDDYGHKLTKEQQEFFKDTKTTDHEGNLKVLYHGSRNPLFTEFNTEQGVWLTDDSRYAEVYADMWHSWRDDIGDAPLEDRHLTGNENEVYADEDYRLYKMYANISNPLNLGEIDVEITNKEISKLAKMVSVSKADIQRIVDSYYCGMVFDITRTGEFMEMARNKGYDGFSATESGRNTWCAFDAPNQVKLTTNGNPTSNPDIRYSLSPEQEAYFKDSKVRDENGRLLTLYHGTPKGSTTIFDKSKTSKDNDMGQGIYFSTDESDASSYMGKSKSKKLYRAHVNIKNPFVVSEEVKISIKDAVELLKLCDDRYTASDVYQELLVNEKDGFVTTSQFANTNISIHLTEMLEKSKKYDGIIDETVSMKFGLEKGVKHIIALHSNQIKLIDNTNPTSNPDIRYSLSPETESKYNEAVKNKDTETAQRIVDEVAKENGYTIKAYHGTPNNDFTVFDKGRLGKGIDQYGAGFYFATNKEAARGYGSRVIDSRLAIKNPIKIDASSENGANLIDGGFDHLLTQKQAYEVIKRLPNIYDAEESILGDYYDSYWETGAKDWMIRDLASKEEYRNVGYLDSDLFRDYPNELHDALHDVVGYDGIEVTFNNGDKFYVAWFDNQMKSGDAVTYDDTGNVIPLSERFNEGKNDIRYSLSDSDGTPIDNARITSDESDFKYSISYNSEIAKGQSEYVLSHKRYVTDAELEEAHRITQAMVDVMMKYSSILPEDKIDKVLTKNGSYDRSVENTTICVRTLAYNEFVDKVQEEIGRPLTQMESFLVSQKLYDIATDPQCLYCYVSLDRKAFNDMLLRYMQDRDTVIAKYNNSDKSPEAIEKLYEEFLNGRKDTKPMKERFDKWLNYVDNGTQLLSLADIATEARQTELEGNLAEQLKDARKYAQSASWSKIQKNYVAYRDEILKLGDRVVKNLNEHYGLRWYSFSDYSPAFIVENMQQITDAAIRGLKGLSYTKDTDFAEVFAPSGMNINVSVFVNKDADGNFYIDEKQSANLENAIDLRKRYPNVGIVATVTDDEALRWAGEQEWTDVIIPFHIVRTGADVAEYYKWLNYTSESADTIKDKDLWNSYVDSLNLKSENARKKVSKNIYPNEHNNDKAKYLALCESRGLSPRFVRFAGEDWYMKLVNETRLSAAESSPLKPSYNLEAAQDSFQKFIKKGGYEGGWYKDGVDVDAEAKIVAEDVLAGKKANEVDYGRQDGYIPEKIISKRKTHRTHGKYSLSDPNETPKRKYGEIYGEDVRYQPTEDIAPVKSTASKSEQVDEGFVDGVDYAPMTEEHEDSQLLEDGVMPLNDITVKEYAPAKEAASKPIETVRDRNNAKLENYKTELSNNYEMRKEAVNAYNQQIAKLQAEYDGKKDKYTGVANSILQRIERLKRVRDNTDAQYEKRINDIRSKIDKMNTKEFKTAEQRATKLQEYTAQMEYLIGDTSTWKDKKLGISYEVNTLRRNLRDIVRDSNGKRDIARADEIYEELQGKYNHNEAELNREANRIKKQFADMKLSKAEDTYIQMLGEFRYNPSTTLTEEVVKDYYEKHKRNIDDAKVEEVLKKARPLYDELLVRVNKVLSEQGMKEIPYRKGYFPHFKDDKQGILGKIFNWKTKDNEIPTSIAGLTEMFEPVRSYQSFDKQRKGDDTDYSFSKGLDAYVRGALDWIYHIEDIQKRRAFENHIRYTYSEEGIKAKIEAIHNNEEYDADEAQEQIELVYAKARNPLNNFIQDFHTQTNTLAGKKSTFDRDLEQRTNRKVYSVMTNLSNRVTGNMVAGSVSSALTNFIPITQSWVEVSPVSSLVAMRDTIKSTIRDDGTIDKSDFLTNRLKKAENLYKTNWDKASEALGFLMESIDSFTSQTVWRSKYRENLSSGMSENEAIKNADRFAANVMADRSRGNQPTLFDSKSPLAKIFTAFQLEVNNQYGYMFKDAPQDIKNKSKARLIKGYATAFLGAYAYNALYSTLTGRDAALDPIGIIEDLMRDLGFGGDDEEEKEIAPVDVALNFTNNILEEVPFIGGLLGGGRIPLSSALPYGGIKEAYEGTLQDLSEGNKVALTKEWLNPIYYLAMPMGGGQIRKTQQGLGMFSNEHPLAGSYTDSGNLRFPVDDTPLNRIQAGIFGQYANKNARTYFDEGYAPLKEKQIQEYKDVEMPIEDYWKYREKLKGLDGLEEKFDFVAGMDIPVEKKNILINNIVDRKEKVDLENYDDFESYEEFDFYAKNTEKYEFLQENNISYKEYKSSEEAKENYDDIYSWYKNNPEKVTFSKAITDSVVEYRKYTSDLYEIRADKDSNGDSISGTAKAKKKEYIWSLPLDYGQKIILFRSQYSSKADKAAYNRDIVDYLNSREDISYDEMNTILRELDFTVDDEGNIYW